MTPFSELRQQAGLSIQEVAREMGFDERTVYRWESGDTSPRKPVMELLRKKIASKSIAGDGAFSFIDLFAGIGGFRRAFEPLGGRCVFTSEWDTFSQKTYRANYAIDHELAGDITAIPATDVPAHDVLLAGFPCQPFSLAGVSKKNSLNRPHGFQCNMQGTLFFDVARIIQHHRPKAFLLENVKNLKSHDKGRTFDIIMRTLREDLGYNVQTRIIDARAWVPQHRERIFIVGFRDDNDFDFDAMMLPAAENNPSLRSILHPEDGSEETCDRFTAGPDSKVLDRYTLSDHLWTYLQNYAEKHRLAGNGFGFGLFGPEDVARTLSARYHKDGSEILIRQEGKNPRRLTPRECARLMGFETPGGKPFEIVVSDTQAYRQFGNAVVAPVVRSIAAHMVPFILGNEGRPPVDADEEIRQVA
ncbi:DNA (cytosine-5-)-methyltransferase [Rhizobium sp. RM]|uniref:DNA (cytosine-5-)-methyltransferase n=1 Tax=Rhizobium sp. RM TaxID=2748079 RepID=UPI00110E6E96|nr:DNA (cytosine-5-)-methyltransferase [Rhizobium sp. RM]NWJ25958.1 DNA (cytosine-5-)-methyltransferase [Rhizobium sp. RM]TMV15764.1 DNA (cytosine-5-)-methyltransferase [Rhizobium sp. Td3]